MNPRLAQGLFYSTKRKIDGKWAKGEAVNHIVKHLVVCKAFDIALGYCKKLALQFSEKVVRKITAPILEPIERFIETVSIALFYSLVVAVLIAFASAIPRTAARGA